MSPLLTIAHPAMRSRAELVDALKAVGEYSGHSRDGIHRLRIHALAVHTKLTRGHR
jgi:hypothetical protein